MNLEIHNPELIERVNAQIQSRRLPGIDELLEQALDALDEKSPPKPPRLRTGQELIDACARVSGLLTDEEVDRIFSRNRSSARPVDFE
jgi:hypothetical protein